MCVYVCVCVCVYVCVCVSVCLCGSVCGFVYAALKPQRVASLMLCCDSTGGWDWAFYTNTENHGCSTFTKGIWKSVYIVKVMLFSCVCV